MGVCHRDESGLIAGTVAYRPDPLEAPGDVNLLIRCSELRRDVSSSTCNAPMDVRGRSTPGNWFNHVCTRTQRVRRTQPPLERLI
jgi:hypothetical protein